MPRNKEYEIESKKSEPGKSVLGDFNQLFHEGYKKEKSKHQDRINSGEVKLVVRMDDRLIAVNGQTRDEHKVSGRDYHSAKALCHIPLAIYYAIAQSESVDDLERIKRWLDLTLENVDSQYSVITESIVKASHLLVDAIDSDMEFRFEDMRTYTNSLEPEFGSLIAQSAYSEVESVVTTLDKIYKRFDTDVTNIFFVVFGGHQPRYKEITKLIFKKWFSESEDRILDVDHHIHFSESGKTVDDAVQLIATVLADQKLATTFLHGATNLNQDVLGIAADKAIADYWKNNQR